jgi:hypothetical protein
MSWASRKTSPLYRDPDYIRARAALIAAFQPGQPCCLCGHPITTTRYVEAQHQPGTTRLAGLCHGTRQPCPTCGKRCNQADGARRGRARQRRHRTRTTTIRW